MLRSSVRPVALLLLLLAVFIAGPANALPPDPAARGLDVYLHVAPDAAPGGILELSAKAYGFPTVTHAVPLAGAVLEVGWDPEQLDGLAPPPSVQATTDSEGRARLSVEVPPGLPRQLQLLVAIRHGAHSRTQVVPVARGATASVELHTADTRVVPTSTISAWVRVLGTAGEPLAGAGVVVSLLEGGVARHSETFRTDRGGLVMARVPIPRIDEPVWQWTLQAKAEAPGVPATSVTLTPREESPGTPTLEAEWQEPKGGVLPGARVPFKVRLRDATGQPVIEHAITWWIGVKGTTPPRTDKEWEKVGTRAATDGAGEVNGARDAPTLVKSRGSALVLVARSVVEGHPLERTTDVAVGAANASATLTGEAPAIVPGLSQKMLLAVFAHRNEGVAGKFTVTADGLSTTVTTDARGEAELTWAAPLGVGANREVGPCAGGVAAAVTVRKVGDIEALRTQQEPFMLCVPVDRDAAGVVRVTPNVAKPGEKVRVTIMQARNAAAGSHSVVLRSRDHAQAITGWLDAKPDGTASADLLVPASAAPGSWDVSVALPEGSQAARVLATRLLVVPATLPLLTAKRVGGRATPGGVVDFEAQLTDGHGKALQGAVSAIVVDAFGGGDANVSALDTRARLCGALEIDAERCTAALERDPATETVRRVLLGGSADKASVTPVNDPGAHASKDLEAAFAAVLHSLEGAIFESAKTPQSLMDARRKDNGRWIFNPELLTLVTDAMDEPPQTPGGEKLVLGDLVAVDPQVTFDNVARRVTRLKLFTVLQAVRNFRKNGALDPDEPVFRDPNALIRRLVREGALADDQLLDPWGGTIQYVRSNGPAPAPFLGNVHGFELRAPGPDGKVGTGDDVRDPFERVVRSGTPYARAVQEDRIVDAKWDMVVAEETVAAWERMFEELTGQTLGSGAQGLGLSGFGSGGGGTGTGRGIGLGSVGTIGHGRGSSGVSSGDAYWSAPLRTDAEGRVRLSIPLGGAETTWRVALVGVPDGLGPASTTADVASDLPLSLRVEAGTRWVEGDVIETEVLVRNRTAAAVHATIDAAAEGAAALDAAPGARAVDVPARGARTVRVRVRAAKAGEGRLVLTAHAPGLPDDLLRHSWEILPAGEKRALTQTAWVDGDRELGLALDHGYRLMGEPRLVLERGFDIALASALESLEPERQISPHGLVDSLETALRIQRWATTKDSPRHRALAAIAERSGARALGRFNALVKLEDAEHGASPAAGAVLRERATMLTKQHGPKVEKEPGTKTEKEPGPTCPPEWSEAPSSALTSSLRSDEDEVLDIEPADGPETPPCWGAYVASATRALAHESDAALLARALVALADRPRHAAVTASLSARLRKLVKLDEDGEIDSPSLVSTRASRRGAGVSSSLADRARRATVYAALLRTQRLGTSPATASVLFGKIAKLRDVTGGYGSSSATTAVVRALLASQIEGTGTSRVRVRVRNGGLDRAVDVPASGSVTVPLPAGTLDVEVHVDGPGLVARLERPVLRSWTRPPPPQESPVGLEVVWPASASSGTTGTLRVLLRHGLTRGGVPIDVQIPLPPGVTLAATTRGTSQVQGVLAIREVVDSNGAVLEVPLRFGLAGKVTVPEATARVSRSSSGVATAPARALTVR